ncbi:MAG TPA: hypothetical protein VLM38_03000 [Blastocatellia bacterium]|nr:hypothetical protein [Blastocatellia bacterium]
MFTIIIITLLVLLAGGLSLYIRQIARSSPTADRELRPRSFGGLFSAPGAVSVAGEPATDTRSYRKAKLMERARSGDLETLSEAWRDGDQETYQEVLETLIDAAANSRESLRALVGQFAASTELKGNRRLAERVIEEWTENPDSFSTAAVIHVAALSDDAATYGRAVDIIVTCWKVGQLARFSAEQLVELVESQYWILAPEARRGGEGFALKTRLAELRRELAAATRVR